MASPESKDLKDDVQASNVIPTVEETDSKLSEKPCLSSESMNQIIEHSSQCNPKESVPSIPAENIQMISGQPNPAIHVSERHVVLQTSLSSSQHEGSESTESKSDDSENQQTNTCVPKDATLKHNEDLSLIPEAQTPELLSEEQPPSGISTEPQTPGMLTEEDETSGQSTKQQKSPGESSEERQTQEPLTDENQPLRLSSEEQPTSGMSTEPQTPGMLTEEDETSGQSTKQQKSPGESSEERQTQELLTDENQPLRLSSEEQPTSGMSTEPQTPVMSTEEDETSRQSTEEQKSRGESSETRELLTYEHQSPGLSSGEQQTIGANTVQVKAASAADVSETEDQPSDGEDDDTTEESSDTTESENEQSRSSSSSDLTQQSPELSTDVQQSWGLMTEEEKTPELLSKADEVLEADEKQVKVASGEDVKTGVSETSEPESEGDNETEESNGHQSQEDDMVDAETGIEKKFILDMDRLTLSDDKFDPVRDTDEDDIIVVEGKLLCDEDLVDVAIKTTEDEEPPDEKSQQIIDEAKIWSTVRNPYVTQFLGLCLVEQPMLVMDRGEAIRGYLRKHKNLPLRSLCLYMKQVADGMSYLAGQRIVHRNLAARNVLLYDDNTAKITDFKMAKRFNDNDCYVADEVGKWPIKWYAPECIYDRHFYSSSDVWSYGVTLWEVFKYGSGQPYKNMKGKEIIEFLEAGKRLEKPPKCPNNVYNMMRSCWQYCKEDRPKFSDLAIEMEQLFRNFHETYTDWASDSDDGWV